MTGRAIERATARRLPAGARPDELTFPDMLRRAEILAKTELVPKALQGKPEAIVLVGTYGAELGVPFTTSLRLIDVIENRPEPSAQLTSALIRRHGHELYVPISTTERAVVRARRAEDRHDESRWVELEWTIEQARRAELTARWVERWVQTEQGRKRPEKLIVGDDRGIFTAEERARLGLPVDLPEWAQKLVDRGEIKSKDNWQKYPAEMLRARAIKAMARMHFSDVLAALGVDPTTFAERDSTLDADIDADADLLESPQDEGRHATPPGDAPGHFTPAGDDELVVCSEGVAGCDIDGDHTHDQDDVDDTAEQHTDADGVPPAAAAPEDDPATWDTDRWRDELDRAGVKPATALRAARAIAEERGEPLPRALDDLSPDLARHLHLRLALRPGGLQ